MMKLQIGDKAVYPAHGVAQVVGIESRSVSGVDREFYILKVLGSGLKLLVPTDDTDRSGLRELISKRTAGRLLAALSQPVQTDLKLPWTRRSREYHDKIGSGDALVVARVVRELHQRQQGRALSHSERKLFEQARSLIATEIALACECGDVSASQQIDRALAAN